MTHELAIGDPLMLGFALVFACFAWALLMFAVLAVREAPGILFKLTATPLIIGLMLLCAAQSYDAWGNYLGWGVEVEEMK